jgi:F0F1-type ATP synthase assembly protein I
LIIASVIIGIITVILDSLLEESIMPLLVISGIGFVSGIVVLNYKAKHSKRDKGEFRRTNTRSWGV